MTVLFVLIIQVEVEDIQPIFLGRLTSIFDERLFLDVLRDAFK